VSITNGFHVVVVETLLIRCNLEPLRLTTVHFQAQLSIDIFWIVRIVCILKQFVQEVIFLAIELVCQAVE
jgi:hypothetical protein